MTAPKVTETNIREYTYKNIYEFIGSNKSSSWNYYSAFPNRVADLPAIVINPANITFKQLSLNNAGRQRHISVLIEFYCLPKEGTTTYGKKAIDAEKDKISAAIYSNLSSFYSNGLIFRYLEDEESDEFIEGENKINYGGFRAYFYLN